MKKLRFGKHAPKNDYRTLLLHNYLTSKLAPPPAVLDVLQRVYSKLKVNDPTKLFPMDANDQYGDCTIAALAHATTVYKGLTGKKKIFNVTECVKTYFHLTGGIDSGLAELDVLNYWRSTGVDGEKILAFVKIDKHNHEHVKQAIQLFGGVYLGFQVQENCEEEFAARKPWTPGKLTNDGHAVYATGYDKNELTVLTWGDTQQGTWAWWDKCVDEAYAILPSDARQGDFAPGFDFKTLQADLQQVAN